MKPALLTFALDVLAIAVVAVLGLARVLPPEAVIGFFCTVWAAGRGRGGDPPSASSGASARDQIGAGVRHTLIARTLTTFAALARGSPLRTAFA